MSAFASRCLVAFILVQLISVQSFAKGGGRFGRGDDRYNRDNIESLPPEIRNVIFHLCGKPMALHTFASYADNLKRVVLHFEHFYCEAGNNCCGPSGCLHQIYVSSDWPFQALTKLLRPHRGFKQRCLGPPHRKRLEPRYLAPASPAPGAPLDGIR